MPYPTGDMRGQERAGLPPKIDAGNKKSLFLDALKFRKAEKSPKNKKARPKSGVEGEVFPLVEGWSDGVDSRP